MTIEGKPKMQTDGWEGFYNARRDRLADIIGDYISCESSDARQCYEEILAEIEGWISYHQKFLNKATALKALIQGERIPSQFLTE